MKCPECGYDNKDSAAACNLCGTPLRGGTGTAVDNDTPWEDNRDVFPTPSALLGCDDASSGSAFAKQMAAREREQSRRTLKWFLGAAVLLFLATVFWIWNRMPYPPEKVDVLYAKYTATATSTEFPGPIDEYLGHREEKPAYLFQIAYAYEAIYKDTNPYADIAKEAEYRREEVEAGRADPGSAGYKPVDTDTLDRIDRTEGAAHHIYGVRRRSLDTLRSMAGGDERGREQRQLQMELVVGEKESAIQTIEMERMNQIGRLRTLEKATRAELNYFIENGTPKLRSIAERLHERLFESARTP